jgi:hypothetical protein
LADLIQLCSTSVAVSTREAGAKVAAGVQLVAVAVGDGDDRSRAAAERGVIAEILIAQAGALVRGAAGGRRHRLPFQRGRSRDVAHVTLPSITPKSMRTPGSIRMRLLGTTVASSPFGSTTRQGEVVRFSSRRS